MHREYIVDDSIVGETKTVSAAAAVVHGDAFHNALLYPQADQSPLRRALRAHFERFGGVLESKALAAGEDAIYKDTARRAAGGRR